MYAIINNLYYVGFCNYDNLNIICIKLGIVFL